MLFLQVFNDTGTVWENYSPEEAAPGSPAKPDFCGWGGLGPVAVLFEFIFGLCPVSDDRLVSNNAFSIKLRYSPC